MKYIAIDLGTKTMGIATSNNGIIASPRETYNFKENHFKLAAEYIINLINNEKFDILILGYPKNMNNTLGCRIEMVDNFIKLLKDKLNTNVKIKLEDERLTTRMANNIMLEANLSRKKRKSNKDTLSAQLILTTYLNKQGNK